MQKESFSCSNFLNNSVFLKWAWPCHFPQEHVKNIYPKCLVLNNENVHDSSAHVIYLNINIVNQHFIVGVYDIKRDDFPFDTVQYMSKCSNMSVDTLIGVFGSQLIRFSE